MKKNNLQKDFSAVYANAVFDAAGRTQKARKALSIIQDCYPHTAELDMLDIGCAAGFGTRAYAERFRHAIGIDIDEPAVAYAAKSYGRANLEYAVMDSQRIAFPDNSFDVIICTHVYEHVPDSTQLMSEIYRLLKVGGACYFTAGNRISLIEPHYRLPLLSVLPKSIAHLYLGSS
jgi:2-polyprenyl-3-methyl-5-hydroxy-6-metoxy-1,4-benzoquinol methylase